MSFSRDDPGAPQRRAGEERRQAAPPSSGLLRVPFVRRCELSFDEAPAAEAFLVNINTLGAYVAFGGRVRVGDLLSCRFTLPGNETVLSLRAMVAWVNERQRHPVHSLPPGFGLRFLRLGDDHRLRLAGVVEDYVRRHPHARG